MKLNFSYMEVIAKPSATEFSGHSLEDLRSAMDKSAIHTFGWPIAAVLHTQDGSPKPIADGIESQFNNEGHREYWRVMRTGEFYFLGELFENNRRPECVFLDTRTNRIAETFLRIGRLFLELQVPKDEMISLLIKHGNIKGKKLAAASPARVFFEDRTCNVEEVKSEVVIPLADMLKPEPLKKNVHTVVRKLAEMFDMFDPDKAGFTDPIVEAFLVGRIL